jgi:RHS repeat-associated protein
MGVKWRIASAGRTLLVAGLAIMAFALTSSSAFASSDFNGNSCTSTEFCMVVGSTGSSGSAQILIEKWNGSAWTKSSYSNPSGATESRLNAVACRTTTECKAVGSYVDASKVTHSLAMAWNGTSWSTVSVPEPSGATVSKLSGISCVAATDCKAVGTYTDSAGVEKTLAEHWNGTAWSIKTTGNPIGNASRITAISCTSASDCRAVGTYVTTAGANKAYALSWNGTAWSLVTVPFPVGATASQFSAVACLSTSFCRAAGSYTESGTTKTMVMNWDGSAWSIVTTPNPSGSTETKLAGISCLSASVCYAVGSYNKGGSETFPLAMSWNGTVWSEQTVDSESFAATTVAFASISCPSSSVCQAVGSLTYGKSAANRAFGYLLSEGKWNVIGSDGYQRSWSTVELPAAGGEDTAAKADVSCSSSSFCMRVGASLNGSTATSRTKSWNGSTWTTITTPSPSGAQASELTGVACISSTNCRAVGNYVDSTGVTKNLVLDWNGTAWSVRTPANPVGTASRITAISCTSASDCRAVGTYVTTAGANKAYALSWNGTAWSLVTTPNPPAATASQFFGVSCRSTSFCRAVGSYTESGTTKTMVMNWNGSAWSLATSTNVSGAKETVLQDVSCSTTSFCLAVGYSVNSESKKQVMAERYNGIGWGPATDATGGFLPTYPTSEFNSVACVSYEVTNECRAAGRYAEGSGASEVEGNFVGMRKEQFNEFYWLAEQAEEPVGVTHASLSGVSCASQSSCVAVGRAKYKSDPWEDTADVWAEGSEWTLEDPSTSMRRMTGVACPSASLCVSVGYKKLGSTIGQRAWKREGEAWSSISIPEVSESELADVACTDSTHCTAVGQQGSRTLAVRWNGTAWSTQTTADPEVIHSSGLEGVDCPTTTNCMAVGYKQTNEPGLSLAAFSEEWDGTTWTIRKVPRRAGSTESWIGSVSCPSTSFCVAVGAWDQNSAGEPSLEHSLIEQWDGTSWHSVSTPEPESAARATLGGVSCTSSTACTAVGTYNGQNSYMIRWNGTAWSLQEAPSKATGSSSVDCVSSTKCVYSGYEDSPTSEIDLPLVGDWDGTVWLADNLPSLPTISVLQGVSCNKAVDCVAVGEAGSTLTTRPAELILMSKEAANQEVPDTVIVSGPSGTVTSVKQTFNFASTEAGGGYECSIDGGAYAACTPPKVYTLNDGSHTFKVRATDIAGNVDATPAERTFTVSQPPETTITSPTPSYTSEQTWPITFTSDDAGATFKCALDTPTFTTCTSPYTLPTLGAGWHTFEVKATDAGGVTDATPAKWEFNRAIYPGPMEDFAMTSPSSGQKSPSHFTLKAKWAIAGVSGVSFQIRPWAAPKFTTIPAKYVVNGKGEPVSWPLKVSGASGETEPLFFDAYGYSKSIAPSESLGETTSIRAVFDGIQNVAGATAPVGVQYEPVSGSSQDAREQIGPGQLNLLTGGYSISRTDVSIPVPGTSANLEFGRVYDSQYVGEEGPTKVLGGNWQPSVPVAREQSAKSWRAVLIGEIVAQDAIIDEVTGQVIEEAVPAEKWAHAITAGGESVEFAYDYGGGKYVPVDYAGDLQLTTAATSVTLTEPNGDRTVFEQSHESNGPLLKFWGYQVKSASTQANSRSVRMVYDTIGGESRLSMIIAPAAPGVTCQENKKEANYAPETVGCRSLTFQYSGGHSSPSEDRLMSITYFNASVSTKVGETVPGEVVARYGYFKNHNGLEMLVEAWDPRISPALTEKYEYWGNGTYTNIGFDLVKLTPPGEEPWNFTYSQESEGSKRYDALRSLSRATLVPEAPMATTTIVYDVPISGSKAPYDMSAAAVAKWGQTDYAVNATAVFPPTEVPSSSPPSSYARATVHYMDPDGYVVNTAFPQLPGASGPSITTNEIDENGNLVRSLGAQARLIALETANPVERSHELEAKSKYSVDGTQLEEQWGPLHEIRLGSGAIVEARAHSTFKYNEGATEEALKEFKPHLITTATAGARIPGQTADLETSVTKTEYDWKWLKPKAEIMDPSGLNLKTTFVYDGTTGLLKEHRMPANPAGGDARTTKTIYYTASANSEASECGNKPGWANLPCKMLPAAQPTPVEANPQLPITKVTAYSPLDRPTEVKESTAEVLRRTTTTIYDAVGRPVKSKVVGTGQSIPTVETVYSAATGKPVTRRFVCEAPEVCTGFDNQATTVTYNAIGEAIEYEDADGNTSATAYDTMGRPAIVFDGKGTQTYTYDSITGALTQLVDSAAGTFTASYNADGRITAAGLPNGLTAQTTYDETGTAIHRRYQKTSGCSTNCTWFDFHVEQSIHGQWLKESMNTETNEYSYDKAGRLTLVKERPEGTSCTTRSYSYDANSNRTKLTTRSPGAEGACDTTSAGTVQNYSYDTADRLIGGGIVYDSLGRITSLPEAYAGGGALTVSYYVNDLVRSQTQGGLTNTYELDASLRQRKLTQSGTKTGSSVFHYARPGDSPAWVAEGAAWTRSIGGPEGSLAAIQESSGTTALQLTDLQGDVIATASLETSATGPLATFKFDEFGNPKQSTGPRYGWLGGNGRRTELPSGVVQMGVRAYVPAMGRFTSPDPLIGGSANAYDYAMQDPINNIDLDGEKTVCRRVQDSERVRANHIPDFGTITIRAEVCFHDGKTLSYKPIGEEEFQKSGHIDLEWDIWYNIVWGAQEVNQTPYAGRANGSLHFKQYFALEYCPAGVPIGCTISSYFYAVMDVRPDGRTQVRIRRVKAEDYAA